MTALCHFVFVYVQRASCEQCCQAAAATWSLSDWNLLYVCLRMCMCVCLSYMLLSTHTHTHTIKTNALTCKDEKTLSINLKQVSFYSTYAWHNFRSLSRSACRALHVDVCVCVCESVMASTLHMKKLSRSWSLIATVGSAHNVLGWNWLINRLHTQQFHLIAHLQRNYKSRKRR